MNGYSKHFAVNKLCAAKELQLLGIKVSAEYIGQLKVAEENKLEETEKHICAPKIRATKALGVLNKKRYKELLKKKSNYRVFRFVRT